MANLARAGVSEPAVSGEAIERGRRRRRAIVIGTVFAAGAATGLYTGAAAGDALLDPAVTWPPAVTLAMAATYTLALIAGSWLLGRRRDEVQVRTSDKAASVAAAAFIWGYPLWFLLWRGGFAVEPMHGVIFVAFWLVLLLASLFYRFR
jgi:uncharacterized protein YfiM (DUF2279 family)